MQRRASTERMKNWICSKTISEQGPFWDDLNIVPEDYNFGIRRWLTIGGFCYFVVPKRKVPIYLFSAHIVAL